MRPHGLALSNYVPIHRLAGDLLGRQLDRHVYAHIVVTDRDRRAVLEAGFPFEKECLQN